MSGGLARVERAREAPGPGPSLLLSIGAVIAYPFDRVLVGMVGAGLGIEALCEYLGLSRTALDYNLVRLGLRTPHDRPLRKGGSKRWSILDVMRLIAWRAAGIHPATIARRLDRSVGGVYAKSRRLGIPRPDRNSLRRVDPQSLSEPLPGFGFPNPLAEVPAASPWRGTSKTPTGEPPSPGPSTLHPSPVSSDGHAPSAPARRSRAASSQRELQLLRVIRNNPATGAAPVTQTSDGTGSTTAVRPAAVLGPVPSVHRPTGLAQPLVTPEPSIFDAPAIARRSRVQCNERLVMAVSMRYFGGQHWRAIAADLNLTPGSVRSIMTRSGLPRDHGRLKFGLTYDAECAFATLQQSGYVLIRDNSDRDRLETDRPLFWRHVKDRGVTRTRARRFQTGALGETDKYKGESITVVTRRDLDATSSAKAVTSNQTARGQAVPCRSQKPVQQSLLVTHGNVDEKRELGRHAASVRSGLPSGLGDAMPCAYPGNGRVARGVAHP